MCSSDLMFADIVNSSSLVIGRDPEAANNTLLPMLQGMIDAVHQYGGTVLQILGDGIMAAFGAPESQEDHAVRACLAAEQMRRELGQWPTSSRTDPDSVRGARIRVGINSGEVLAQELLADRWPEYRAAGEAVYVAARLTQAAKPGVILVSAATAAIVLGELPTAMSNPSDAAVVNKVLASGSTMHTLAAPRWVQRSTSARSSASSATRPLDDGRATTTQKASTSARRASGAVVTTEFGAGVKLRAVECRTTGDANDGATETDAVIAHPRREPPVRIARNLRNCCRCEKCCSVEKP